MLRTAEAQALVGSSFFLSHIAPYFINGGGLVAGMSLCGSLVFVMNSDEVRMVHRLIYVPLATFVGVVSADDILSLTSIGSRAVAAFFGAAVTVAVASKAVRYIQSDEITKDLVDIFTRIFRRK